MKCHRKSNFFIDCISSCQKYQTPTNMIAIWTRSLTPKISCWTPKSFIKICHVDQKMWNKADSFIFGGGHFAKINMAATRVDCSEHPFKNWSLWPTVIKKVWHFCPPCKYYDPKAPSYNEQCWRSYESSKVRDVGLYFLDRFEIWKAAGQSRLLSSLELY